MQKISEDILARFALLQNPVWQSVSLTASEAAGVALNFALPIAASTLTADLYADMGVPKLIIQFAFADTPEAAQVVLIPQELVCDIGTLVKGEPVRAIDETVVADCRHVFEAIVQGICLAVGTAKHETIVATALSMRFQIFSFPPNLQHRDYLLKTTVTLSGDGFEGQLLWLMDSECAHHILGIEPEDSTAEPFLLVDGLAKDPGATTAGPALIDPSLEILLDIPIEITVELGRTKLLIREVLELGTGSVIEIDKAAGEPVDVLVNGRFVARGEVVVIEDNFGVRVTEILSPLDRLTKLSDAA